MTSKTAQNIFSAIAAFFATAVVLFLAFVWMVSKHDDFEIISRMVGVVFAFAFCITAPSLFLRWIGWNETDNILFVASLISLGTVGLFSQGMSFQLAAYASAYLGMMVPALIASYVCSRTFLAVQKKFESGTAAGDSSASESASGNSK